MWGQLLHPSLPAYDIQEEIRQVGGLHALLNLIANAAAAHATPDASRAASPAAEPQRPHARKRAPGDMLRPAGRAAAINCAGALQNLMLTPAARAALRDMRAEETLRAVANAMEGGELAVRCRCGNALNAVKQL
jgi:hypothetical protein